MDLKKHLDRAEQALNRGQADFAVELCDQVMDFAQGEARAAALLAKACLHLGQGKNTFLAKIGAGPAVLAAGISKLTRNPDGEASARRRGFIKNSGDLEKGYLWADALERAGYAGAALGVFGALSENHGESAKRAGGLAAAQGEVDAALEYYQRALDSNPRDTEAMRARKNLAAEQALRTKRYAEVDSAFDLAVDPEAVLRAARGEEELPSDEPEEEQG